MYVHHTYLHQSVGTPIQNNIPELYSLLNFMHEEEFRDKEAFLTKFGTISTEDQVKELQEILSKYCHLVYVRIMTQSVYPRGLRVFCVSVYLAMSH